MGQRRHHYERAFEDFLRDRRVPYVSVDEARKALLPEGARLRVDEVLGGDGAEGEGERTSRALKSFDFVVYGPESNLLVDVKGRRIPRRRRAAESGAPSRLQNWVTLDDVESLRIWEGLFGAGFVGAFAFIYWCDEQPADALFQEIFTHTGRWYAVRSVEVGAYASHMRTRSPRWRTVHLPSGDFDRLSRPFFGV